jgi:hypothetical protein
MSQTYITQNKAKSSPRNNHKSTTIRDVGPTDISTNKLTYIVAAITKDTSTATKAFFES